jgi:hypothetical protein
VIALASQGLAQIADPTSLCTQITLVLARILQTGLSKALEAQLA